MALNLDPDFALQSRLTFGRRGAYLWPVVGVVLLYGLTQRADGTGVALTTAGMFFLLVALPYAAVQVLSLEAGGRLDQRRLTGQSSARLGIATVAGSAWVTIAFGVVLVVSGWMSGDPPDLWRSAALVAIAAAAAALLLTVPAAERVDRVLLTGVCIAAAALLNLLRISQHTSWGVLAAAIAITIVCLPRLARRFRHAPAPSMARFLRGRLNPRISLQRTQSPEYARALLTAGDSTTGAAAMIAVFAVIMTIALRTRRNDVVPVLLVYLPLLIAGYECGARSQVEHRAGGIDRLRLSAQPPWRQVLQLAAGFGFPFVAVSIVAAMILAVMEPAYAVQVLAIWPVSACLFVFWGLAGGLRERKPGVYLYVALALTLAMLKVPLRLMGLIFPCAVALPVAVANRSLDRGGAAPLEGWAATAGSAACGLLVGSLAASFPSMVATAGMMALAAGLFVRDGAAAPIDRSMLLNCAAAAASAGLLAFWIGTPGLILSLQPMKGPGGLTLLIPLTRSVLAYVVLIAVLAGAGLLFGVLIHGRFGRTPGRSLAVRSIPMAIVGLLTTAFVEVQEPWPPFDALRTRLRMPPELAIDLGLLIVLLMAIVALWIARPRAQRSPS